MPTVAERLRTAIERWPAKGKEKGVRRFQREMAARAEALAAQGRGLIGISYPSINGYLNDPSAPTPSVDFLREAADLLGVRFAWLVAGEGAMTLAEELVRVSTMVERGVEAQRTREEASRRLFEQVAPDYDSAEIAALFARLVGQVWAAELMEATAHGIPLPPPGDQDATFDRQREEIAGRLAPFILAPIRAWQGGDLTGRRLDPFMVATIHALSLLVPERGYFRPGPAE